MMHFHLTLPYGSVREAAFSIAPGECLLLAGPNGCGKTTLLQKLAAVGRPSETASASLRPLPFSALRASLGPSLLSGRGWPEVSEGLPTSANHDATKVSVSPQEAEAVSACPPASANCVLIPTGIPKVKGFTLEAFIRSGCYRESDWAGRLSPELERRMENALEQLGISHLAQRDLSTLSDGEFQKGCIAIGLTRQAQLLLLDEPTAFLDPDGRVMVLQALRQVAETTGMAILFSSHDLHDALRFCTRVLAFTPQGLLASTPDNRTAVLRAAFPNASLA